MDWREFCEQHGIEYREGGVSSARDNIYISCPMCGDDEKKMMGLHLVTGEWGCWKGGREHAGSNPAVLVSKLLHIPMSRASEMVGNSAALPHLDALRARLENIKNGSRIEDSEEEWEFSADFLPASYPPARQHMRRYLRERLFRHTSDMLNFYQMKFCFKLGTNDKATEAPRIVLPIISHRKLCVGFTARAVNSNELRYYSRPSSISDVLYNANKAMKRRTVLVIVEGPFDALKLDWAARCHNLPIAAVAIMGLVLTDGKIRELAAVAARHEKIFIVLDRGARFRALSMQRVLPFPVSFRWVPSPYKDPGSFPWRIARDFLLSLLDMQ